MSEHATQPVSPEPSLTAEDRERLDALADRIGEDIEEEWPHAETMRGYVRLLRRLASAPPEVSGEEGERNPLLPLIERLEARVSSREVALSKIANGEVPGVLFDSEDLISEFAAEELAHEPSVSPSPPAPSLYGGGGMSARRFRKKPVEVEAVQWTGENREEVEAFVGAKAQITDDGAIHFPDICYVFASNYAVRERDGYLDVIPSDVFLATYEPVEEGAWSGTEAVDGGIVAGDGSGEHLVPLTEREIQALTSSSTSVLADRSAFGAFASGREKLQAALTRRECLKPDCDCPRFHPHRRPPSSTQPEPVEEGGGAGPDLTVECYACGERLLSRNADSYVYYFHPHCETTEPGREPIGEKLRGWLHTEITDLTTVAEHRATHPDERLRAEHWAAAYTTIAQRLDAHPQHSTEEGAG